MRLIILICFILALTFTVGCMDEVEYKASYENNDKSEVIKKMFPVPVKESEYTNTPELVWSFKPFGENKCDVKVYKISGSTYMAISNHYYCPISIGR